MGTVTAFIVAGGRSSRMGFDKALLFFRNQTLLERALQTATAVVPRVVIAGPRERYAKFGDVVEDIYPDCGPLSGIHSALGVTGTDLNLVLAVDMPLMTPEFLSWLVVQAGDASELIVVPEALGGLQPLCAVYRRDLRAVVEQSLKDGDYKIGHLFTRAPTRYISEAEICRAGFSPEIFRNVNSPEEYEALMRDENITSAR